MKQITIADTIGALCSDDYKGINNQYVGQGKVVIIESIYGGGTESIVTDEIYSVASDERSSAFKKNVCDTLTHHDHFRSPVVNATQYAVRRLMPIECERLQGLPDNYTFLPGEKCCSDSARYKALGNGMAQPCADFVIRRIVEEVENENNNNA